MRILLLTLMLVQAADAAAHKQWMNDASDAQEDFRDAIAAGAGAKAAEAATKIADLMSKTEGYWALKKADDGVKLARDARLTADTIAAAAKAGKLDAARESFAGLTTKCNACHELHLEKR